MDNSTGKNPKVITGKRYLILGRPAGQLLFCLSIIIYYLYCIVIPIFYAIETHFPEKKDIQYTEGLFTYREVAGKKHQVGIVTGNNTEFFSCRSKYLSRDICEISRKYYNQLEEHLEKNNKRTNVVLTPILYQQWQGKPAKVGWFTQRYNIFSTGRRLAQLIVDGKEIVTNENIKKDIIRINNSWIFDLTITSPILLIIFLLIRNLT